MPFVAGARGPPVLGETYAAALQHDRFDPGGATLVGVVRRPMGWFSAIVDENRRALGPPEELLSETKARSEALADAGRGEVAALEAAWRDTDFAARYREHLRDGAAADALSDLVDRARGGEDLVLVCYEADDKPCHRHLLLAELRDRVEQDR